MTDPNVWTGTLPELREHLQKVAWGLKGEWAWRLMPRGALVAMRVREDFRKETRIARKTLPAGEEAAAKWRQEVGVFAKHLELAEWTATFTDGKAEVFFLEPEPYSDRRKGPSTVPCADCGEQTHHDAAFNVQRCTRCAMKAGQAEVQRNLSPKVN